MRKKQSMEEIYLENRHWVYGSFLRKTGEIETAEDLSQTLWLRFFQNYENLNLPNEKVVRAYLRSMILHAEADYRRSTQKAEDLMKELENLLEADNIGQDAVHAEAFPDDAIDNLAATLQRNSARKSGFCSRSSTKAVIPARKSEQSSEFRHRWCVCA